MSGCLCHMWHPLYEQINNKDTATRHCYKDTARLREPEVVSQTPTDETSCIV